MKVAFGKILQNVWKPAVGAAALSMLLVGCGDDSSNPDPVTVDELKYPGNLVIKDQGNGKAILEWSGANNEEDFDGYNVYGMKGAAATLLGSADKVGKPLELLDDAGEPNAATKTILSNFNYDPAKKLEEKGTAEDPEAEFAFFPIHTKEGDTRYLPTCKVTSGACKMTTAATLDKTASDPTYAVNGKVTFEVPDTLTVGENYCFLVLSTMDQGAKVSQTSSNVACFVPKFKAEFDIALPAASANNTKFDIAAYMAACTASGCGDANTTHITADAGSHYGQAEGPLYIENGPAFVAGKNSAVIDLGFYADGFNDATLPGKAPTLVLDTDTTGSPADRVAPIFNGGGYSSAGQSIPIVANHMYVIAVGDADATTAVSDFNYHWIYIKGTVTAGSDVAVEMRLAKLVNE